MNPRKSHLVSSFAIKFINLGWTSVQLWVRSLGYQGFFLFRGTWQSSALSRSGKPLKPIGWLSSCSLRFWSCKKVYTNWQVDFWRCVVCKPKQEKSLVHLQALRVTSSCRCSLILAPILPVPLCTTGTKVLGKTSGGKRSCDTFHDEQWHYYFLL